MIAVYETTIQVRDILHVTRRGGCAYLTRVADGDAIDTWTLASTDTEDEVLDEAGMRADTLGWVVVESRAAGPDVWVLVGCEHLGVTS